MSAQGQGDAVVTLPELSEELLPCRECGAPCQVEVFDSERIKATIWICSQHERLGGACSSGTAYLSEDAWNTRSGQLVERDGVAGVVELLDDLETEADLCRNEGADDIAALLDRAIAALTAIKGGGDADG